MPAYPEHSSVTVSLKGSGGVAGQREESTVIWLNGEHDVSNASRLSEVIAETIALDDEDVVVDLSGASFISGATIAIFARANAFLNARSRRFILRSPRRYTIRLLGLCGLTHLISPPPHDAVVMTNSSAALRTWVDVPIEEREGKPRRDAKPANADRPNGATVPELVIALNEDKGSGLRP
ncbi:MAG TPA: STAS domain-containing protein [Acidimicrobiales bacterium]|nr:STAS domain-containing protein [Acidimicrobiales bacterium]